MEKNRLHNTESRIEFKVTISRKQEVNVYYNTDEEEGDSYSFPNYVEILERYFDNLISNEDKNEIKLSLCSEFLSELRDYQFSWVRFFKKNKEEFDDILNHYIQRYDYISENLRNVSDKSLGNIKEKLTLKQKVIILEYLGFLDALTSCKQEQHKANIVSLLIEQDFSNVKKALANNVKIVEKGGSETKTIGNLEVVRDFFKINGLPKLADKIQESINTITKR